MARSVGPIYIADNSVVAINDALQQLMFLIDEVRGEHDNSTIPVGPHTHNFGGGTTDQDGGPIVIPPQTIDHDDLTNVTSDQHHTKLHSATHGPGGVDALKLDNLDTPDDNTDLDAQISQHGLLRKLDNNANHFLDGQGNWSAVVATATEATDVANIEGDATSPIWEQLMEGSKTEGVQLTERANGSAAEMMPYVNPLERRKLVADTPDDEFDSATLASKWTVVDGGAGTVNLIGTSSTGIYDLSTRPGWLLAQLDNGADVELRQDFTLPDGASIVMAISAPFMMGGASATLPNIADNEQILILGVNDDDSSATAGNGSIVFVDSNTNALLIGHNRIVAGVTTNAGSSGAVAGVTLSPNKLLYLRILRSGLAYYTFFSLDGVGWNPLGSFTHSGALTNVWITLLSSADPGDPLPIVSIPWIRQGGGGVDPW